MIFILQKYIFRELARSFVLTAVALTVMLGFGGGLQNTFKAQGITAFEMMKLMVYLIPVVLAYSLPVAALFSTTITYGRFSADNEINACRASGINIHKLLAPAFVLSLVVTAATFGLENFAIPDLMSRIERLVRKDMQGMVAGELMRTGYLSRMGYAIHCGQVDCSVPPKRNADGSTEPGYIQLSQVAFMEQDKGSAVFYGTAKTATIVFDHREDELVVAVFFNQVRAFDEKKGQMVEIGFYDPQQSISTRALLQPRIKFLPLPELLATLKDPLVYSPVKKRVDILAKRLRLAVGYDLMRRQFVDTGRATLEDEKYHYTISADDVSQHQKDGSFIFQGNVTVEQRSGDEHRIFKAREGRLTILAEGPNVQPRAVMYLENVKVRDADDLTEGRSLEDYRLSGLYGPAGTLEKANAYTVEQMLDRGKSLGVNSFEELVKSRLEMIDYYEGSYWRSLGELHTRLAYSTSALVLLILGAGLGIIFKGGHFVSAFGLSFIPMLFVVVIIITGKRICGVGGTVMGPAIIWFGLFVVIWADVLVLGKFLKR